MGIKDVNECVFQSYIFFTVILINFQLQVSQMKIVISGT